MPREQDKSSIEYAATQLRAEPAPEPEEVTEAVTPEVEPEEVEELETVLEESEPEVQETEGELEESEVETEESEIETDEEEETEDYYAVKIDGEEYQVTQEELIGGYQRQKDYTKKTQSLAEERKANEAKSTELESLYQNFLTQSQQATELLNRDLKKFEALDWEALKTDDPVGYVQKQIEVQEVKQAQVAIQQQAQAVYEHNQKTKAAEQAQNVELQRKEALRLFPEWKSEEKANANQTKIIEYARSMGYQDAELASIVNAKELLILDKARKYDSLQATKQGITKKARPAIRKMVKTKGVAPKGARKVKELDEMKGRLHSSGSLKDAAALLHGRRQARK
jgi:hypothetical protein